MYNNWNQQNEIVNKLMDAYIGYWTTVWFSPYFIMGTAGDWEKLGITMNGIKPICNPK
jgi:hypothetical protein